MRQLKPVEYPQLLREIPGAPKQLFIRGAMPAPDLRYLCVVGSRACTAYGRRICASLIAGLARYPVAVVSGMALGIDAEALKDALDVGLPAIAILPSSLDDASQYPVTNRPLAQRILARGGTYNAMIGRIAALAGAIPTQIEVPDLPTAFATGRVDVMITSASTGVDTKSQDYLSNYIDTQAWLPRNIVFVNKAAFDKLTPAQQKAVKDAAKTAEERGWKMSVEEMTVKTKALKDAGIKVTAPTPALKAGFAKIGDTIAGEWAKSAGADGAAMLAAFRK